MRMLSLRKSTLRTCAAASALLSIAFTLCARAEGVPKPSSSEQLKSPQGMTEVGVLTGAPYRIDIPTDWNHRVVVYYHGYAMHGVTFHIAERLVGQQAPFFDRHYAVIQSAYSQPGWALPQAYPETEALRRYFAKKFGQPAETYVAGGSMGGALVMVTLELNPKPYIGGLDLCGSVGPTYESFERRFALRAAFDHYFPNLLGPLVTVPPDFEANQATRDKIAAALKTKPDAAALLRALLGVHTDASVASDIAYYTFVIGDMQRRAGGNPFDNRNYLYTGTNPASSTADYELNDNVRRYTATPSAREYLMQHYTPTGRLQRPMVALHTLYDPVVQPGSLALYDHLVQSAGFGENLVQEYVKREGHCNITQEEEGKAFDELVTWVHHGPRPTPGALKLPPLTVAESHPRGR
jgi:pimeloyl-ACP methyl ester carboxylesterase